METIKDQGKKQVEALNSLKPDNKKLTVKKYAYDDEDSTWVSKQNEIFNEFSDKRLHGINEWCKNVNLYDLIHKYQGNTRNEEFNKYDNILDLINKIKNGQIKPAEVKNNHNIF